MAARLHTFVRDEVLPSYWANRIQDALAGQARVRLERQDATHVRAVAGADDAASVLNIGGLWRLIEANAVVAHPGGGAGDFAIFATAKAQNVVNAPQPNTDNTDYSWALAITPIAGTPAIVAGVVDVFRRIGRLHWDGAAITQVWQEVSAVTGAMIEDAAVTPGQIAMTRQPDGSIRFDIVDGAITDADIAAGAGILPAKIAGTAVVDADARLADQRVPVDGSVTAAKVNAALKGGAPAATEALRALGATGTTAAAGNDARLSDQRVPTDASVTAVKIADALKPSAGAAAGTEALRALGATGATAAAGNDARLSDTRVPTDNTVTTAKLVDANVTKVKLANDALNAFLKLAAAADRLISFGVSATGSFGSGKRVGGSLTHNLGRTPLLVQVTCGWLQTFGDAGQVPVLGAAGSLNNVGFSTIYETSNGDATAQSCVVYWLAIG